MSTEEESRWWCDVAPGLGEGEGENNLLTRVGAVTGHVIAGIVDEEAGGIVAFAHPDTAEKIVTALNALENT